MKLKGYAILLTSLMAAMLGFDAAWTFTKMEVQDCLAISLFLAIGVAVGFMFLVDYLEKEPEEEPERKSMFVDMDGLNVLVQQSSKKKSPTVTANNSQGKF